MRLVVSKGLEKSGYKYQGSQITRHRRASQQVMDKSDWDLTSQTVSLRYIDSVIHNRQVRPMTSQNERILQSSQE